MKPFTYGKKFGSRGFTLIELMVVIVILGILAGLIVPRIMGRPEEAKQMKAKMTIESLETSLRLYKLDNGSYPSTEQGLQALVERPDTGSISIDGQPTVMRNPADALAHQISIISQELSTVRSMTVLDNVFLGSWADTAGLSRPGRDRKRFAELSDQVGFHLDPYQLVGELSIAQQQQVEVLRAALRLATVRRAIVPRPWLPCESPTLPQWSGGQRQSRAARRCPAPPSRPRPARRSDPG